MELEESLFSMYKTDFDLKQYGHFTLEELNDLIPYERDIYLSLLIEKLRKEEEARQRALQRQHH